MHTDSSAASRRLCFGPPAPDELLQAHRERVSRLDRVSSMFDGSRILNGLSDDTAVALADLLPCLLCGEESAVQVFANEGNRVAGLLHQSAGSALFRIAAEEEYHEELLSTLASRLPVARDLAARRRLSRRYFQRILSRDIGEHFARIAALDSAVCIILGELIQSRGSFPRESTAFEIFSRIGGDEGRHVRFSRHYASALGVTRDGAAESFELVRRGLVDLLRRCGDGFDALAVDPDRLFRRLVRVPRSIF